MRQVFVPACLMGVLVALPLTFAQGAPAVEPFFPQICSTVDAQLKAAGGNLAAVDEQKLDTSRIQRAIDRCGRGRAVRLRVNQQMNAFLTGPLVLKAEVALILDRGVRLFASRDAKLYARSADSCGVVNDAPAGCKPLISVEKADDTGIMGDGVIDGRGGEKLLGSEFSWWELAGQAGKDKRAQAPMLIGSDQSDRVTVYRVTLKDPPADAAMSFNHGDRLTVWGVDVQVPQSRAAVKLVTAGASAKNVAIARSEVIAARGPGTH